MDGLNLKIEASGNPYQLKCMLHKAISQLSDIVDKKKAIPWFAASQGGGSSYRMDISK